MGDRLRIEHGSLPWKPAPGTELVQVLDRHDMPTVGVISQGGNEFLFWCVVGHTTASSVWAYVLLEEGDRDVLAKAHGPDEFDPLLHEHFCTDEVTIAVSRDGEGIIFAFVLGDAYGDDLTDLGREILESTFWVMDQQMDQLRHEVRRSHRPRTGDGLAIAAR